VKVVASAVTPMLGANLGAIRRISPQTVMDAPGHIHSDYRDPLLLIAGQAVTHHAWDPVWILCWTASANNIRC
jgi:hypothetical protein